MLLGVLRHERGRWEQCLPTSEEFDVSLWKCLVTIKKAKVSGLISPHPPRTQTCWSPRPPSFPCWEARGLRCHLSGHLLLPSITHSARDISEQAGHGGQREKPRAMLP